MSETIINGIDVSECKWFNRFGLSYFKVDDCVRKVRGEINQCRINNRFYGQEFCCEDNPNCYFKQFKRLEQENKELKEQLEFSRTHKAVLDAERINYKQAFEEIRYCNNCSNLGLDFEARKFYCSLSHRPDELPEVLSCDEFSTNCYIKRLQEENKRLQMLSCANCGEKYLSPEGSELYDKMRDYKDALEEIKNWATNHNPCDIDADINCTKEDCFECLNYDIKKITKILDEVLNDRD